MPPIAQPPRQPVRELHGVARLAAVTEIRVPLNAECASTVQLRIALLPQRGQPEVLLSLLDERSSAETDAAVPPIQLLESQEYTYEWEGLSTIVQGVFTDPAEVFQPDTVDGLRGRLRPGLRTGRFRSSYFRPVLYSARSNSRCDRASSTINRNTAGCCVTLPNE